MLGVLIECWIFNIIYNAPFRVFIVPVIETYYMSHPENVDYKFEILTENG